MIPQTPQALAQALGKARREGDEWLGLCPCHPDKHPSLSFTIKNGKLLFICRAGCDQKVVLAELQRLGYWPKPNGHDGSNGHAGAGVTVEQYAAFKKLPADLLRSTFKITQALYKRAPCLEMPYFGPPGDSQPYPVKRRVLLGKTSPDDKTTLWKKGHRARIYGLWMLPEIKKRGEVILVEGESDTQTCWLHDFPALGVPGWGWNEDRDAGLLDGVGKIYVTIEPDNGGASLLKKLARSAIRERLRIVRMPIGAKDPSALHLADPEKFVEVFQALLDAAEPPPVPDATNAISLTEDAVALNFVEKYRDRLRFCHETGSWFQWNDQIWHVEKTALAFEWCRQVCREEVAGMERPPRTLGQARTAAGVERFARADRAVAVTTALWDKDPFLLGTPAGTVELRSGLLRNARQTDYITKSTLVAPAATANCPLWLKFLREATHNDEPFIRFLQQWCGYTLTGDIREHALLFIFGSGGNGKGVFLNTASRILGDYATVAAMETFTASKNERHPTDLAMLRGARLVYVSETEEGHAWAESRIKSLTGGDPITARFMRQDFFTYWPNFKITIIGNHKPILRNVDDANRRRFNLAPFDFKPETIDQQLQEKLVPEYPAILRRMIDGGLDWQKNGLIRPRVVHGATSEYFADQDTVRQWRDVCCDVTTAPLHIADTSSSLYASWRNYAAYYGEAPGTAKAFADKLKALGHHPIKDTLGIRGRGFAGIKVHISSYRDFNDADPQRE